MCLIVLDPTAYVVATSEIPEAAACSVHSYDPCSIAEALQSLGDRTNNDARLHWASALRESPTTLGRDSLMTH